VLLVLAFSGLALGLCGLRVSRAGVRSEMTDELSRQVTIFGIIATPESKAIDTKLVRIKAQLDELMPKHGFQLLDAQSKRIVAGESVSCDLVNGYKVETGLVKPLDENGKVQVRCELFQNEVRQSSTLVKTPLNQLFFCQQELPDGAQLLIGIGAR
jgi:hypothetical protein